MNPSDPRFPRRQSGLAARAVGVALMLVCGMMPLAADAGCSCLNNASVHDLDTNVGGTDGQFAEHVVVNAPSGQTWTVTAAPGAFDAFNVPPVGVQSPLVPIATNGSVVMAPSGGTTYTLDFVFIQAQGYSLTVANGQGTSLSIGNNCRYPNPVFAPAIASSYFQSDPPVTLGAAPASGPPLASAGFTIDGAPQTVLVPAAFAPAPAIHTVELTATGTQDAGPSKYMPCVQAARKSFVVGAPTAVPAVQLGWGSLVLTALLMLGFVVRRRR